MADAEAASKRAIAIGYETIPGQKRPRLIATLRRMGYAAKRRRPAAYTDLECVATSLNVLFNYNTTPYTDHQEWHRDPLIVNGTMTATRTA